MKTLKRLALRALLSKEQRAVILNSVAYSEHKYRAHGDVDGAIRVGIIRKELEQIVSVTEPKFTKTQVDRIVKAVLCDFTDWLRKKEGNTCVAVGTVVEKERCDKCEHRDECEVRKALFNDADDKGNDAEEKDTANGHENDATEHSTDKRDQPGAPEAEEQYDGPVEMTKEGE